ncbi:hypothetical protein P9112_005459 [Eukaryota sp. TZLM1-RC]
MSSKKQQSQNLQFYEGGTILPFNLGKCPKGGCLIDMNNQSIAKHDLSPEERERYREVKFVGKEEGPGHHVYPGGRILPQKYGGGKAPPGGVDVDEEGNITILDAEKARQAGYEFEEAE